MKKIIIVLIVFLWISCSKSSIKIYSDFPDKDLTYRLSDGQYTNFEHYMFDEGFPDSIIIELKRNDSTIHMKIPRYTILEDSLGNYYSPGYAILGNDKIILYDIKGRKVNIDN